MSIDFADKTEWSTTPDADGYVGLPSRESLLITLSKRIESGKAVQFVSGAPGMGKTLLARILERDLSAKHHPVCLVNASPDAIGLVEDIVFRLGLAPHSKTPPDDAPHDVTSQGLFDSLIESLSELALRRRQAVILLLDEAQLLHPTDVVYLVSALGARALTQEKPPVYCILFGHPELEKAATQCGYECIPLLPLERDEAMRLIHAKSEAYGGTTKRFVLTGRALADVLHASQGNPQMLVRLTACLFMAMADEHVSRPDKAMIAACLAKDPDVAQPASRTQRALSAVALLGIAGIICVALLLTPSFWSNTPEDSFITKVRMTTKTLGTDVLGLFGHKPSSGDTSRSDGMIMPQDATGSNSVPMLLGGVLATPAELNQILVRLYGLPAQETFPMVNLLNPHLAQTPKTETVPILLPSLPADAPPKDVSLIVLSSSGNINDGLKELARLSPLIPEARMFIWFTPKTGMHVDIVLVHSKSDPAGYEHVLSQLAPSIRANVRLLNHFPEDALFFSRVQPLTNSIY
ncbi:ATP-binding protein [Desulfovibrio inopinatus]|uniref:ATP-binding protein n=1 Tax=Desulfovibrio inopinatus TaxID=102109 RepID=UPI000489EC42|nr:ATP-binding protein [Desulfovibrio inopinatus]